MEASAAVGTRAFARIRHRLWSLPTALILLWAIVLIWGEHVVFQRRVGRCQWQRWETWVSGKPLWILVSKTFIEHHHFSLSKPNLTTSFWSPTLN